MSTSTKRSASPLPRRLDDIRRIRIADAPKDESKSRKSTVVPAIAAGVGQPTSGQEILSLSPSLRQDLCHTNINDLILQTTVQLASEGKRLVRAPRLLSDGIAFDWISDVTAPTQDIRNLLLVEGIRSEDLDRVLLRATPVSTSRSATEELSGLPRPKDRSISVSTKLARNESSSRGVNSGIASTPIVIDEDDDDGAFVQDNSRGVAPFSPALQDRTGISHDAAARTDIEDRPPSMGNRGGNETRWSNDSSLGLVNASVRLGHGSPTSEDIQQTVEAPAVANRELPVHRGVRLPDYGTWKSFAEDSSDAETRPSSRESSVARTSPPPAQTHAGPSFSVFPRSYDTSELLSERTVLTAPGSSRPERRAELNSSRHERNPSTSYRDRALPRMNNCRPQDQVVGNSANRTRAETIVPPRPVGRRPPMHDIQPGPSHSSESSDQSEDGADTNGHLESVQRPKLRMQRSDTASSRNLHIGRSNTTGVLRTRRNASDSGGARRPESEMNGGTDVSPEDDSEADHQRPSNPTSGHTVVIPKADYARGRRLLAPTNPDNPLTTILMRGEAHFVDQRRKTRISTYSLPVEDDARHVEDACLIGDDTVVVGYNRGPCQVSLISVGDDQQPCRHDLSYRAHSTVIENRSLGKAFPNRGIACLAPVAGDSFVSGGHDKTVHHWKISRGSSRRKGREGWSASSVRIPMDHTQPVHALAYCGWNETVYSASGDRIASTKLGALAHAGSERVSGKIIQVHVHPQDPRLIALEIDHMDYQVQLYDTRTGGFARKPWLEFGHRTAPPTVSSKGDRTIADTNPVARARTSWSDSNTLAQKSGSRYTRGSTLNSLFARGYGDGVVLVWDYRNGAQKKVLERFQFQRPAEVAHTLLSGSDVIAYGAYSVTFWSMLGAKA
ncbi:hypothetical protein C8T65DRAFT_629499 [Cerioporus squamosus]|nr:hypothetical protein C8T65DRAFT_629499 [Cerioporus squamosus]